MADPIKILSYGGGLNSFAMLLYSIDQGNPPDWCVFADTGSGDWEEWSQDGEWYGTYRHIVEYAIPICEANGIKFKWITSEDSKVRGQDSLLQYFEYLNTVPGRQNRFCSEIAKIQRIEQWQWETFGDAPLEVWVGFEAGEENRRIKDIAAAKTCGQAEELAEPGAMTPDPKYKPKFPINRRMIYPLIGAGICRCRCEVYVRNHEHAVPRKSACWFCPYGKRGDWMTLAQQMPEQFDRAAMLERDQKGTTKGEKIHFFQYQKKGKKFGSPLYDDIHRPYTPRKESCKVCCRNPKATKTPGIDYLTPAEYVEYEEPLGDWQPGPWDEGFGPDYYDKNLPEEEKPPSCEELVGEASLGAVAEVIAPESLVLPAMNLTQFNVLQWLGARLGEPVVDGSIGIPLNRVKESQNLLKWFHRSTEVDRDLDPDSAGEVEVLQDRLDAERLGI